ncbi:MAG: dienelactone hydrolase family protein [Kineosporiaceae bacterium]
MLDIALFPSALGVRTGVDDAATRLRRAGHDVHVIDQYDGESFDDYETARQHVESIGFPALLQSALDATSTMPDGFVVAGFSNGAGMAEHVALHRPVAGVVLLSGALPLPFLGAPAWPSSVPVQLHYSSADPFRDQAWVDGFLAVARASGAPVEFHDYPSGGHLFTDPGLPEEYDAESAELLWKRVESFLDGLSRSPAGATVLT